MFPVLLQGCTFILQSTALYAIVPYQPLGPLTKRHGKMSPIQQVILQKLIYFLRVIGSCMAGCLFDEAEPLMA